MVRSLRYSTTAVEDLVAIASYIGQASGSRATAKAFVGSIREQCMRLALLEAQLGRPRPELRPDLRSFAFKGHVIFFRYLGPIVELVRILERHRDVSAQFAEDRS